MKQVRIGVILCILLAGYFVTFYGGIIPYRLFQCALFVPISCLIYTLYVYERFKIYQQVGHKTLVKDEAADYLIQLANEDFITYEHIKLNFFDENATILDVDSLRECYMLPGEKKEYNTSLLCHYRGNYSIGVKSIQVTDFLHLFSITYPFKETYKVTVLPKKVSLEKCFFLEQDWDQKAANQTYSLEQQELDTEIRPYIPGDDKRLIQWKAFAKYQELFTRKYTTCVKQEVSLYIEMRLADEEHRIAIEDKMLESALAITDYCIHIGTQCHVIYEQGEVKVLDIRDYVSYEAFYESTAQLRFRCLLSAEELVQAVVPNEKQIIIFLVCQISDSLLECISNLRDSNKKVVLLVCSEIDERYKKFELDIPVLFVPYHGEVKKLLEEGN